MGKRGDEDLIQHTQSVPTTKLVDVAECPEHCEEAPLESTRQRPTRAVTFDDILQGDWDFSPGVEALRPCISLPTNQDPPLWNPVADTLPDFDPLWEKP